MLNPRRAAFLATDLVKGVDRFGNPLSSPFGFLRDALQLLSSLPKQHKDNVFFSTVRYSQWQLLVKFISYLMASRMHLNQVKASVLDLEYRSRDLSLQVTCHKITERSEMVKKQDKTVRRLYIALSTISKQLTLNRAPAPELSSFSVKPPKTCSNSQSISGKTRRHKYELRITRDKLVKPVTG